MELEGRIVVFIRLDGEQPVSVLEPDATQVNSTRVVAISSGSTIAEAVAEQLKEADVYDSAVLFDDDAETLADALSSVSSHMKEGANLHLYASLEEEDVKVRCFGPCQRKRGKEPMQDTGCD